MLGRVLTMPQNGTSEQEEARPKEPFTTRLDAELLEEARNAAYWDRRHVTDLIEEGLRLVIARLCKQRPGDCEGGKFKPVPPKRR
jgi:hypothetical protein